MTHTKQFQKIISDHGREAAICALIHHWAGNAGVELSTFKSNTATRRFIDGEHALTGELLLPNLKLLLPHPKLKDVERAFELTLDKTRSRSLGMVYTPEYIIDYLTRFSIDLSWKDRTRLPRICDPSCGSGGFLLRIAEILETQHGISGQRAFNESLIGIDVDTRTLEQARCLIELYLASKKQPLFDLSDSLIELDTLTTDTERILSLTRVNVGFDVIVTNPPYVKFQNLDVEYRQELIEKYNGLANGNFSLSVLFLVKGYELLSPSGCLGMITQNNLFTSISGTPIREFLQERRCLRRVVDFGHQKIFNNASAYTCLIFLVKQEVDEFDYASASNLAQLDFPTLQNLDTAAIRSSTLRSSKWRLGKAYHLDNLRRIETIGQPLGEVANIRVGFATLKDSVFFVQEKDGICFANSPEGGLVEIESGITRAAIKVSELRCASDLQGICRRIIFPYYKSRGIYHVLPEQKLRSQFPRAFSYLSSCRKLLEARDKGRKTYESWYAWARSQGMDAPGPKLLTKTFSKFPQFFLDRSDQLFCNGYSVSEKPQSFLSTSLPIEFLEKVLNSTVMYYYAKLTSFQIEGNFQCYQKNFIERFGIPELDFDAIAEVIGMRQGEANDYLAAVYGVDSDTIKEIVRDG